jgi:hypothetical protein
MRRMVRGSHRWRRSAREFRRVACCGAVAALCVAISGEVRVVGSGDGEMTRWSGSRGGDAPVRDRYNSEALRSSASRGLLKPRRRNDFFG